MQRESMKGVAIVAIVGVAISATACSGGRGASEDDAAALPAASAALPSSERVSTVGDACLVDRHVSASGQAQGSESFPHRVTNSTNHLDYLGGQIISNVRVVDVNWGPNVDTNVQSTMPGFYAAAVNNMYMDWLQEYYTPSQIAGRGALASVVTITPSNASTTLADSDIQTELRNQIGIGRLMPPDANTLYMVHFPPGVTITHAGEQSCVKFCAYHAHFDDNGQSVRYAVLPDLGGPCASGCGSGSKIDNSTSVASHELIEAVTDPDGNAWHSQVAPDYSEIGDYCNHQSGHLPLTRYVVQFQWSNRLNACTIGGDNPYEAFSGAFSGTRWTGVADVNGDGAADAIAVNDDDIWVMLSNSTGFNEPMRIFSGAFFGSRGTWFVDVDNDSMADGVAVNDNDIWVLLSTGTGFQAPQRWLDGPFHGTRWTGFADLDGDGKADGIAVNDNDVWTIVSNGTTGFAPNKVGSFQYPNLALGGTFSGTRGTWFADVNGDHKADGIAIDDNDTWVMLSNGLRGTWPNRVASFQWPARWATQTFAGSRWIGVADIDGDGFADGIAVNDNDVWVMQSNGANAFNTPQPWFNGAFYGSVGTWFAPVRGISGHADGVAINSQEIWVLPNRIRK